MSIFFYSRIFPYAFVHGIRTHDPAANIGQRSTQSQYADYFSSQWTVNHWSERLCGRGRSQQGTQSSAINHARQLLDALMYFML